MATLQRFIYKGFSFLRESFDEGLTMRILKHDWKGGVAVLGVESPDDLWTLKTAIQPGDSVRGSTERK
jgi:hypothetical protein